MKKKKNILSFLFVLLGIIVLLITFILTEFFNLTKTIETMIFVFGFLLSSFLLSIGTKIDENE
ncbi:hypothetical protein J6Q66_05315 [bacterium]|nr:hypothetical protein [bacterium]